MISGQIIRGDFSEIIIRQKSDAVLELGDLFVIDTQDGHLIVEVFDLFYGSQIGDLSQELIAGMKLEGYENLNFFEPELSNYTLARLKAMVTVSANKARIPKKLPEFFSSIRPIRESDLKFLQKPEEPLYVGKIRSGSKILDVDIFLPGREVFSHHVLIPATTGRGKSNLVKVMSWSVLDKDYCAQLILDPHDEYYGRNGLGLKDHEKGVVYYSSNPPAGGRKLKINIEKLRPWHMEGVINFSDAQNEAMMAYYKDFREKWIESLLTEDLENIKDETLAVLRRKFNVLLGIRKEEELEASGIFDVHAGMTTISDISSELENGRTVIIDTSLLSSELEILVGSMITREIFERYKRYKITDVLKNKPVISIVIEEAPRVLGKEAIEKANIFSTIAREGRKFNIGLVAITQLPSLIPKEILANINTKIILGIELAAERNSIIESASQDLSKSERNIASLDIGEAIITSNFTKFAVPVHIPKFEEFARAEKKPKMSYEGF